MIHAQINPKTNKVEMAILSSGESFQREYVGIIAMVICELRINNYSDEEIEKMLVDSIVEGFNNVDEMRK